MEEIFFEISIIIIIAALIAYILRIIKQPIIPAYILAGLLIGPIFGLVTNEELIVTLSEIGIAFLLFIVGLEIDIKKLKYVAVISSIGGIIQVFLLFAIGSALAYFLNFSQTEVFYMGLVLAFSSTAIVVKILSDKNEIDTLHGRLLIGFLLTEDILVILALSLLSTNTFSFLTVTAALIKVIGLFLFAFVAGRYIFPPIFKIAAKSQEILFLMSITMCFLFAMVAHYLGLSIVIGAFIAGVALGNLPYSLEIIGRTKPLKDFFSTIFLVSLGLGLSASLITPIIKPLIIFTLVILLIKPLITMTLCGFFGYKKQPSFITAISLTQISEFSLIVASSALIAGEISQGMFSMVVLLGVFTMTTTAYIMKFDYSIYTFFSRFLGIFEKLSKVSHELEYVPEQFKKKVILVGYNRIGYSVVKTLIELKKSFLIIDYNPEIIKNLIKQKIPCIYGDIGDIEILERVDIKDAEMIISSVPNIKNNILLLKKVKQLNKKAVIFVTANHVDEALELYDLGADYVILPHFLGGEHLSVLIDEYRMDFGKVLKNKLEHIRELHKRKILGFVHLG